MSNLSLRPHVFASFVVVVATSRCSALAVDLAVDLHASATAADWSLYPSESAEIQRGVLVLDGRIEPAYAVYEPSVWKDVTLSANFLVQPEAKGVLACGFMVRVADAATYYYVHFDRTQAILVRSSDEEHWNEIRRVTGLTKPAGNWHAGRLECRGDTLRVFLNNKLLYKATDATLAEGRVGFYAGQGRAHVKDIVISGVAAKPKRPFQIPVRPARIVKLARIWDEAPHNAFTDLVRFDDRWICVFREGQGHVSPDGALRVIESTDGQTWRSAARITDPTADLRDAKIDLMPDERLMLSGAAAPHEKGSLRHQSKVWFSDDGRDWSEAVDVGDPNYWLWRVTWHGDEGYGIGYKTTEPRGIRLYRTMTGATFQTIVEDLGIDEYPNETAIVFRKDRSALCLLRRGGTGLLGTSKPPYREWTWKDLGVSIGGPELLELPDGRFVAATRLYDGGARTSLSWIDPEKGTLTEFLRFPSGGDTSYPGLVWHDDKLWVSYYSSHEGKTSIYLAQVEFSSGTKKRADAR